MYSTNPADIYFGPWIHICTFLAGVWVGWLLYKTQNKRLKLSKLVVTILWIGSTCLALTVIYAIFPWHDPSYDIPEVNGLFYAGLNRFCFAVSIGWVMFACIKGYGGIVNTFLSWKVFMPLGRLCFCMYLTSFHLQGLFHSRLTVPLKYDMYTMVNMYFAHLVMAVLVGFLCTLLLESPFLILVKMLLEGVGGSSQPRQVKSKQTGTVVHKSEVTQENNNDVGEVNK